MVSGLTRTLPSARLGAAAKRLDDSRPAFEDEKRFNEERIRGIKLMSPRPALRHAAVASALYRLLGPLETQALEVYELKDSALRLHRKYHGEVRVRARPFERLTMDSGVLWTP